MPENYQEPLIKHIIENHVDDLNLLELALLSTENGVDYLSSSPALLKKLLLGETKEYDLKNIIEKRADYCYSYDKEENNIFAIVQKLQTKPLALWESLAAPIPKTSYTALDICFLIDSQLNFFILKSLVDNPLIKDKLIGYFKNKTWSLNEQHLPKQVPTLHYATIKNKLSILELLQKNGLDINYPDSQGNTALFYVNQEATLNLFQSFSPDLTILNQNGVNASEMVFKRNYNRVLEKHPIWAEDAGSIKKVLYNSFINDKISDFKEKYKNAQKFVNLAQDSHIIVGDLNGLGATAKHQKIIFLIKQGLNLDQHLFNKAKEPLIISAILARFSLGQPTQQTAREVYEKASDELIEVLEKRDDKERIAHEIGMMMFNDEKRYTSYSSSSVGQSYLEQLKHFLFPCNTPNVLKMFNKILDKHLSMSDYQNTMAFPSPKLLMPWIDGALENGHYQQAVESCHYLLAKLILENVKDEVSSKVYGILHAHKEFIDLDKIKYQLEAANNIYAENEKSKSYYKTTYSDPQSNEFQQQLLSLMEAIKFSGSTEETKRDKMKIL